MSLFVVLSDHQTPKRARSEARKRRLFGCVRAFLALYLHLSSTTRETEREKLSDFFPTKTKAKRLENVLFLILEMEESEAPVSVLGTHKQERKEKRLKSFCSSHSLNQCCVVVT